MAAPCGLTGLIGLSGRVATAPGPTRSHGSPASAARARKGTERQRRIPSQQASRGGSTRCHPVGIGVDFVGSDAGASKGTLGVRGCVHSLKVGTSPPPAPRDTARTGTPHVLRSTSLYCRTVPLSRGGVGPKYPQHWLRFPAPQIILFLGAVSDRSLGPSKQPCVPCPARRPGPLPAEAPTLTCHPF